MSAETTLKQLQVMLDENKKPVEVEPFPAIIPRQLRFLCAIVTNESAAFLAEILLEEQYTQETDTLRKANLCMCVQKMKDDLRPQILMLIDKARNETILQERVCGS